MVTSSLKSGEAYREAARRFVSGEVTPAPGLKLLGRWHSVDMSIGFSLWESDTAGPHYASAAKWADVLDFRTYVVVEDAEIAPILASLKF